MSALPPQADILGQEIIELSTSGCPLYKVGAEGRVIRDSVVICAFVRIEVNYVPNSVGGRHELDI